MRQLVMDIFVGLASLLLVEPYNYLVGLALLGGVLTIIYNIPKLRR